MKISPVLVSLYIRARCFISCIRAGFLSLIETKKQQS